MKERKIHELLFYLRTKSGVGQEKLSRGLCTKGAYSKYESGERRMDRLLLNALIQRMGKSADKLSVVLTPEEYDYFRWKKKVLKAAGSKESETVQALLQKPEARKIVIHRELQQQFVCQMQAYAVREQGGDLEGGIALLKQAVALTMPDLNAGNMQQYLISAEEMQILLALAHFQMQNNCQQEALSLLLEIVDYVERNYDDYEMKVKVYPRAVRLLYPLLLQQKRELEGALLCKKAIELLCQQGVLYDLKQIMEGYLACSAGFATEAQQRGRIERQLWALRAVYAEFGAEPYLPEETMLFYHNQEMYLMDELIRKSRIEKGMSQEFLSEGICTPKNLSRIEQGKGVPHPRNFRALMRKLQTGQDYYNGKLDTNDFLLLEKQEQLEREISLSHWQEAGLLLQELKSKVDGTCIQNQQTLQNLENQILFFKKEISEEEFLKRCAQALGCEKEEWRGEQFWRQFFTEYKARLLVNLALAYHRMNHTDKSIFILEHLLEELKRSKVRLADRCETSMTVIEHLSTYYEAAGQYEKCMSMCGRGIELCFKSGRGRKLAVFLMNRAKAENEKEPPDGAIPPCF